MYSRYLVYCITEDKLHETEMRNTPPTVCPADAAHTIDVTSIKQITEHLPVSQNVRIEAIANEDDKLVGHLRYYPVKIAAITAGNTGTASISWPHEVDLASGKFFGVADDADGTPANISGDTFEAYWDVGTIGQLDGAHTSGQTTITLQAGQGSKVDVGWYLSVDNNVTRHLIISKSGVVFTLDTGLPADKPDGTNVKLQVYYVGKPGTPLELGPNNGVMRFGEDTLDSTRIPKDKTLVLKYTNNQGTATKTLRGTMAILY